MKHSESHIPQQEGSAETQPVSFTPDAHLIQVLGEQLIGSEKVGILELVKNAYDAGASKCEVWIEKVPGLPEAAPSDPQIAALTGPVITIVDDGRGMDEFTLKNGWLRPATRIKTSVKDRLKKEREEADERGTRAEYDMLVDELKREHGGRLPLGEKGVGRFAAARLGRYLILQTKSASEPYEWVLEIDWADFEAKTDVPIDLHKVPLTLTRRAPRRDYGPSGSGTMLRIYGGRQGFEWSEDTVREIGHSIAHLQSSSTGKPRSVFEVTLRCPQWAGEKFEPLTETVPAPFECIAIVDEKGEADIELRFTPPRSLKMPIAADVQSDHIDLKQRPPDDDKRYWLKPGNSPAFRLPDCGPFTVEIKCWVRHRNWIDDADLKEFTQFLDRFGGIGIYRDGLAVLPAQIASKDDWLRLSSRHIKKGSNISYYQLWGAVDLQQERNIRLIDRTSREGLIETRAFNDLRELVRPIVFHLEDHVQEVRNRYNQSVRGARISPSDLRAQTRAASKILEKVSASYDFHTDALGLRAVTGDEQDPRSFVAQLPRALQQADLQIQDLEDRSRALVEVAGYGIAIGVSVHEIEKVTSSLYFGLERLSQRVLPLDAELYEQVQRLSQTAQSLLAELKRLAPLRVTRLEKPKRFRIRDAVLAASGAFRSAWNDAGIDFGPLPQSGDFELQGSFGAVSQIFANLFDNATYWLTVSADHDRRIGVQINSSERTAVVADSGPGIEDKIRPHLFEPFYSLKNPPSGLGLYICAYYARQMKGTIREAYDNERLRGFSGAQFTLLFPKEEKDDATNR